MESGKNKLSNEQQDVNTAETPTPQRRGLSKSVLVLGVVIIKVFILISSFFVILFIRSTTIPEPDSYYIYNGSNGNNLTEMQSGGQTESTIDSIEGSSVENFATQTPPNEEQASAEFDVGLRATEELFTSLFTEESGESNRTQEPGEREHEEEPAERGRRVAYLTFDDGPSQAITPGILDILAEEGIRATFFILPRAGVNDIIRRIIADGHEIGNHSYSHNYTLLYNGDIEEFRDDVVRAREYMVSNFGYSTTLFRFPGGSMSWSSDVIEARIGVLDELGYTFFDWHIDSRDAHPRQTDRSAQTLTSNVLDNTNNIRHVIILMHDSSARETSLEALPQIIEGLREQGYTFDILSNFPG